MNTGDEMRYDERGVVVWDEVHSARNDFKKK
jgi:hypothetical protein